MSAGSRQLEEMAASLIEGICVSAPRLETYERIFKEMEGVSTALLELYSGTLDCIYEVNEYIKRCKSRSRLKPLPEPFQVDKRLKEIDRLKKNVEDEAKAANMELHYKWHEEIKDTLSRVSMKPKAALPCRIVPYPVSTRFTGRKDVLEQMKTELNSSKSEQKSMAIHGMGGVGKTQIALKFVYDHYDSYSAIFWMAADSRQKLQSSFVEAAKKLELEEADSQRDAESVSKALKEWMEDATEEWLMLFDNADDLDVLKGFWPAGNRGTIIITSRNPSAVSLTKASALIKPFTVDDGERLFMSIINQPGSTVDQDDEEGEWVKKVIEKLGKLLHADVRLVNALELTILRLPSPCDQPGRALHGPKRMQCR